MNNENYDVILLGTGLTECILSGVLSTLGYRILHLDRNTFYGGESASLNLDQLYEIHGKDRTRSPLKCDNPYAYSVDLIPKVLLAAGDLVKLIEGAIIQRYHIDFDVLDGSFMVRNAKFHKVPASEQEALISGLMGFFEKRRVAKFFSFCKRYDAATDRMNQPMASVFDSYGLSDESVEFIGHGVALQDNDDYLQRSASETILKCQLYNQSLCVYGKSPYIYPHYGMGELPSYFARLSAVYNGLYCLGAEVQEILFQGNTFQGVDYMVNNPDGSRSAHSARAKWLISDPSYVPQFAPVQKEILRSVCISSTPISIEHSNDEYASFQLIIPSRELGRLNDVFVLQLSHEQKVVPDGRFAVFVSTVLEPNDIPERLIRRIVNFLCCNVMEMFLSKQAYREPSNHEIRNVCVTKSPDSASHFEASAEDVALILERVHGKPIHNILSR